VRHNTPRLDPVLCRYFPGPATVDMELPDFSWVFAYQFFLGSVQFQFWPSLGVPGATLVYPGSGDSPAMEIIVHRWVAYPVLSWFFSIPVLA